MVTAPPGNLLMQLFDLICGRPSHIPVQRQLLNWLTIFSSVISLLVAVLYFVLGIPALWSAIGSAACLIAYLIVRFRHTAPLPIKLMPFVIYFLSITTTWFQRDVIHGSIPLFVIVPFLAVVAILEGRLRAIMIVLTVVHIGLLIYLQPLYPALFTPYPDVRIQQHDLFFSCCLIALFGIGYMGVLIYNLEQQRQQIDTLLYNILPISVAKTLQQYPERNIAHYFENVSILFADIVNFTPLSSGLTPVALVSLLNELFSDFDGLVTKYGVEKVKTIGDCYMIAAGAPTLCPRHAHALAQLALAMQQLVKDKQYQGHSLTLRIGINSGSVVAGVIGKNKFTYDLWGDAVNTASRMESHGSGGVIQLTTATYELIRDEFNCQPQGQIMVKGKGEMTVWYLVGAHT